MAKMANFRAGKLTRSSPEVIIRELLLAADRALWADDQDKCAAIIARIYNLFDTLEEDVETDAYARVLAAETAAWISGKVLEQGSWVSILIPSERSNVRSGGG